LAAAERRLRVLLGLARVRAGISPAAAAPGHVWSFQK
jgi:hypothetical protein